MALRIPHAFEIQTVRRRRDATEGAVTQLQDLGGPFRRPLTASDGHQDPGDIADHVVQEGVGMHAQLDQFTVPDHVQTV